MIVLDTNVLSEALKPAPDQSVLGWLGGQNRESVFTTAVTQAEILHGVALLPSGKRRARLHSAVQQLFLEEFSGRILPFDSESAAAYPKIVARRVRLGRPIAQFDALIAAMCQSRNATLATCNVRAFESCGLTVINPWRLHSSSQTK